MRVARVVAVWAAAMLAFASALVATAPAWAASDGFPDTAFTANVGAGFNNTVWSVAMQADGKIVVGGFFTQLNGVTSNRIARLNADGTPDTIFTTNTGTGFNSGLVKALAVQADGKIVVGGNFTQLNGVTSNRIARLNADGTPDTTFTTNIGLGFDSGEVNSVAVQADGKIVVGGNFAQLNGVTSNRIARLNADGTPDTTFTTNLGTGIDGSAVNSVVVQADAKIVIGGAFTKLNNATSSGIARLNVDGTPDTAFSVNTGVGFNDGVQVAGVQSDGKIVVGGFFTQLNGVTSNRIARLNADGTPDTAFTTMSGAGFSSGAYSLGVQSDGKIVVGGSFVTLNGVTTNRIARLNADGTPDTVFTAHAGTGFNATVNVVVVPSDGKIVVGGSFVTVNGVTSNRIARLIDGAGGQSSSGQPLRRFTFRFLTSEGAPCFTDADVSAGAYRLPTSAVACTPLGSALVGWAIPGREVHFSSGGTVIASADQTFTAVAKFPRITVVYDPNVGRVSADSEIFAPCLDHNGVNRNTAADAAWTTTTIARDGLLAASPVCEPAGMRFLGWTNRPTTNGASAAVKGAMTLVGGSPAPAVWSQDPDPVNTVHLYALWG